MNNKRAAFILIAIITLLFSTIAFAAIPVDVTVGKEVVITLKKVSKRVSIADCNLADIKSICGYTAKGNYKCVRVMKEKCEVERCEKEKCEESRAARDLISINEIVINGKKPGVTTLIVWDAEGKDLEGKEIVSKTFFDVVVTEQKGTDIERAFESTLEALRSEIKSIAPDDDISARFAKDTIILSGYATNQETINKVAQVAQAYAIASDVTTTTKYSAGLTTTETSTAGKVLNHITIKEAQQVMLEVKVAQIDKSKLKELGVGVLIKGSDAEGTFPGLVGTPTGVLGGGTSFDKTHSSGTSEGYITDYSTSRANTFDNILNKTLSDTTTTQLSSGYSTADVISDSVTKAKGTSIQGFPLDILAPQIAVSYFPGGVSAFLKAVQEKGFGKILAEPNLIVRSGERGNFHVGSRIPIQTVIGVGAAATLSITYEEVGIRLNFAPEVLETGVIRLKVDPAEVSSVARFIIFKDIIAPEIDTRTVKTSVDLKEGESLILAGLLSEEMKKNIQKVPILGDIPILGALFRSTRDELQEKELAFFITPKLVKPIPPGVKTALPTDNRPTPEEEKEFQWIPMPGGKDKKEEAK